MIEREFDAKIRKVGNSFVITIPSTIIGRFRLKPKKYITVRIKDE